MSKLVDKILLEADVSDHFVQRFKQRISADIVTLAVEVKHAAYEVIGEYKLPASFKTRIFSAIDFIQNFDFPKNKSFGIKLGQLKIIERDIDFNSLSGKKIYNSTRNCPVVFDSYSNSNGDLVFAIIRNNELKTFYWGKSYVPQTKEKLQVDMVISDVEVLKKSLIQT